MITRTFCLSKVDTRRYEVDQSTLGDALVIEQRGGNVDHFEIVPANGEFPPEEEYQSMLDAVAFVDIPLP